MFLIKRYSNRTLLVALYNTSLKIWGYIWLSLYLKLRLPTYGWSSYVMYAGAIPFRARNTYRKSLYSLRWVTGSQCRFINTGVMWSVAGVRVISLAAMFWHHCSLAGTVLGNPVNSELFMSFSQDSSSRYRRILPIDLMWWRASLHRVLIWVFIDISLSVSSKTLLSYGLKWRVRSASHRSVHQLLLF